MYHLLCTLLMYFISHICHNSNLSRHSDGAETRRSYDKYVIQNTLPECTQGGTLYIQFYTSMMLKDLKGDSSSSSRCLCK